MALFWVFSTTWGGLPNLPPNNNLLSRGSFSHKFHTVRIRLCFGSFGIVCPCWFCGSFVGGVPDCRTRSMFPLFWEACSVVAVGWVQCCVPLLLMGHR